jgi:integrase
MTRTRHALSFEFWPEADRLAWAKAQQDAELFGERGLAAHWADATRAQVMNGYGTWLHFLEAVGALQHDVLPTGRVRGERLAGYVESLKARSLSPISVASRLRDLAEALRVMDPGGDRTVLVRGLRRLESTARASRDKHKRLVAPGNIYEASIARMDAAERSASRGHILKALYYSDGLRTAMLVAKPVRLRNLAGTQLGKNLLRVDDVYRWTFAATETKTGEVIDALLPPRLTPYIERWITHYRRLLLQGAESDAMWISIKGSPMGRADVYERVCITTRQELGVRINPHAFRHIVATGVAIALPEEVRLTPFLLDHRTERTVQEHYNLADSLSASSRYLQHLDLRRRKALDGDTPKE